MKMDELKSSRKKSKYESAADEQLQQEEQLSGQLTLEEKKVKPEPESEPEPTRQEMKGFQKVEEPQEPKRLFDVRSLVSSNEGQKGKAKNLYLDNRVLDEIKKIAEEQRVSESKVVNDILKHVFFGL